jgi:ferric-dicitrate binding protein FerR (iron transport regulator)
MSQELFEKYLRDDLTDDERREMLRLLSDETGGREFVAFLQEWSVMADLSRQMAAAGRESGVIAAREAAARLRRRGSGPVRPAWGFWALGVAAAALFMVMLAVALRPERPVPEAPVAREPEPAPEEAVVPLPPIFPPLDLRPQPAPVPEPAPVRETPPPPAPLPVPPSPAPEAPKPPSPPPAPVPPASRPTLAVVAQVERVEGSVVVLGADESVVARAGVPVHAGDGLETRGPASAATVKYAEGTRVEVGPDSKVEAFLERSGKRLLVVSGSVTAQVAPQPKGRPLVLATPHAEVTVIGTQFAVRVEADRTRLDVLEGRVRFTRLADQRAMEVPAGRSVTAGKGVPWEARPLLLTREFQDGPSYAGTRDAGISEVQQASVAGSADTIEVDGDESGGKSLWALLSWDVSSLPPTSVVREAVVTLHVSGTSQSAGYSIFEARRPWIEGEATWKTFAKGQPWGLSGAKSRLDRGGEALATFSPREKGTASILLEPAGVALVQSWVRNPRANHGLLIGRDASSDGFSFESREAKTPSRRPKLTVTYTPGK